MPDSRNGKSSVMINGSRIACCRVGSVITLVMELIRSTSFRL